MDMGKNYFLVYQKEITQMNERIRQLALEADKDVGENVSFEFCERFAQLIVQECIVMADDFECDVNQRGLVDRMKQHFGVEE
jgi:hypothetical protein